MKTPKIFRLKIETSLLAYCEEDFLYQFIEDLRNDSDTLTLTIPFVSRDVVDVTENIKIKHPYSGDVILDNQDFQNGIICKLETGSAAGFDSDYSIRFIGGEDALMDGEEFGFRREFFKADEDEDEDLFTINDSLHWWEEVESISLYLRRFGRILRNPSTFHIINEYEPDSLRRKCEIVNDIYESWLMFGDEPDEKTKNIMNYYFLRYPLLEKVFSDMKKDRV